MYSEIVKIGGIVRNREKFVKRRQRLLGPNGMTLKALELLSGCYIMVQGNTVACMGGFKELKTLHKVVVDCMYNIHPIYEIKDIMIRKELMKNEDMKDEIWDRFLPQFKKQTVKRRKTLQEKKQKSKKKEYTPFPPEQLPRKEDLAMASGEYFLSEKEKKEEVSKKKRDSKEDRKKDKIERQAKLFEAPTEEAPSKSNSSKAQPIAGMRPDIEELKNKFLKKKKKE